MPLPNGDTSYVQREATNTWTAEQYYSSGTFTNRLNIANVLNIAALGGSYSVLFGGSSTLSPRIRSGFNASDRYLSINSGTGGSDNSLYFNLDNQANPTTFYGTPITMNANGANGSSLVIGNTSPTGLALQGSGVSHLGLYWDAKNNIMLLKDASATNDPRLWLFQNMKLGIPVGLSVGISTPSSAIEVVNGSITVRGTNAEIGVNSDTLGVWDSGTGGKLSLGGATDNSGVSMGQTNGRRAEFRWFYNSTLNNAYAQFGTIGNNPFKIAANNTVAIQIDGNRNTSIFWNDAANTAFYVNNTNGKIGIGTTLPSSLFDVLNGSITIRGTNNGLRVASLAGFTALAADAEGNIIAGTPGAGGGGGALSILNGGTFTSISSAAFPGASISFDGSLSSITFIPAINSTGTGIMIVLSTYAAKDLAFDTRNSSNDLSIANLQASSAPIYLAINTTNTQIMVILSSYAAKDLSHDTWFSTTSAKDKFQDDEFSTFSLKSLEIAVATTTLSNSTNVLVLQESPDVGNKAYYVRDESTGNASVFRLLSSSPSNTAEVTRTQNITLSGNMVLLSNHITLINEPGTTKLPAGVWSLTSWASVVSLANISQLVVTVSTTNFDGSVIWETLSATATITDNQAQKVDMVAIQPNDIVLSTSDRILVQYYGKSASVLGINMTLYYGGLTHFTHVVTPIGGIYKFVQLSDTPQTLIGKQGKYLSVNDDQTSTVFISSITDAFNTRNSTDDAMAVKMANWGSTTSLALSVISSTASAFYVFTGTSDAQQTKALNFGTTSGVQITFALNRGTTNDIALGAISSTANAFYVFSGTSDANQTKFQNFTSTQDTAINGKVVVGASVIFPSMTVLMDSTMTFTGAFTIRQGSWVYLNGSTVTFAAGSVVSTTGTMLSASTVCYFTGDLSTHSQDNAGFQIIATTIPIFNNVAYANISTMSVRISTFALGSEPMIVIKGSNTAVGGDFLVRFNGDTRAKYSLTRSTMSGFNSTGNKQTVGISSNNAVGLPIFGVGESTGMNRSVKIFIDEFAQGNPKSGTFMAHAYSTAATGGFFSEGTWGYDDWDRPISSVSVTMVNQAGLLSGGTFKNGSIWVSGHKN